MRCTVRPSTFKVFTCRCTRPMAEGSRGVQQEVGRQPRLATWVLGNGWVAAAWLSRANLLDVHVVDLGQVLLNLKLVRRRRRVHHHFRPCSFAPRIGRVRECPSAAQVLCQLVPRLQHHAYRDVREQHARHRSAPSPALFQPRLSAPFRAAVHSMSVPSVTSSPGIDSASRR